MLLLICIWFFRSYWRFLIHLDFELFYFWTVSLQHNFETLFSFKLLWLRFIFHVSSNEIKFIIVFLKIIWWTWSNVLIILLPLVVQTFFAFFTHLVHPTVELIQCKWFISFKIIIVVIFLSLVPITSLILLFLIRVEINPRDSNHPWFSLLRLIDVCINHPEALINIMVWTLLSLFKRHQLHYASHFFFVYVVIEI